MENLNDLIMQKVRPLPVIILEDISGSMASDNKIGILNNLIKKMENIVIVGAMANNFIKHKGYNIGKSIFEQNTKNLEGEIIKLAKLYNCNLLTPQDVLVSKNLMSSFILLDFHKRSSLCDFSSHTGFYLCLCTIKLSNIILSLRLKWYIDRYKYELWIMKVPPWGVWGLIEEEKDSPKKCHQILPGI